LLQFKASVFGARALCTVFLCLTLFWKKSNSGNHTYHIL